MSSTNWKCADGRVLKLTDMTKEHLGNAAAMLRRRGFCRTEEFWDCLSGMHSLRGEMAQMHAENALADMCPHSALDAIEDELEARRKRARQAANVGTVRLIRDVSCGARRVWLRMADQALDEPSYIYAVPAGAHPIAGAFEVHTTNSAPDGGEKSAQMVQFYARAELANRPCPAGMLPGSWEHLWATAV
jgi:hypothetical protein